MAEHLFDSNYHRARAGSSPCPQVGSGQTAILLALGSSVGYGVSDLLASRVATRVAPVLLVLYSQALQSVVLLVVVVVAAVSQPYSGSGLAWGTAAAAVGAAGLVAYYHALATGQTAIVAPLASSGAVLPLLVDLARGEQPGPLAMFGLAMGLAGIAVSSLAPRSGTTRRRPRPGRLAGGSVLWVALGVQLATLPTTPGRGAAVPGLAGLGIDAHALTTERPGAPRPPGPPWPCSGPWSCRPPRGPARGTVERPNRLRRQPMAKLEEGAQAPSFTLPDQDGNPVSLDDFKGSRVLVYFYPADDTPG